MEYKPTIGLEIHIELKTGSKMFCSCKNDSDEAKPNVNICPVCMAHPGVLPVINKEAVEKTIKTALALNCDIAKNSFFERKNYFYPDLPKGYQISQYAAPLSKNGFLMLKDNKKIRIERIHLEEDTGKLAHATSGGQGAGRKNSGAKYSLVDFNRAGVPLMELVTEPDISSAQEAREFIKSLQMILRYLNVSDVNMEKGEMRCEVNISLAREGADKLGTKVEVKNLNSIRAVEKAIETEIKRQTNLLENGKKVVQETRGFNDAKQDTFSQRQKEESHDYRYFPEPDLPLLQIKDALLKNLKAEIPELPQDKIARFQKEYELTEKEAELYANQRDLGEYFEKAASELREWLGSEEGAALKDVDFQKAAKTASNYLSSDFLGVARELSALDAQYLFAGTKGNLETSPENFAEFIKMILRGQISSKMAKMILREMLETGKDPSQIVEDRGLKQITDTSKIEDLAKNVIKENREAVEQYKKGKAVALQFLIGKLMAKSKGKAEPQTSAQVLKKLLK